MLTGIRLVTIALNAPGPLAAARCAEKGAAVLKIEPPGGDPLAALCPSWYHELHDRVRVERLDLKAPGGQQRMRALLRDADLLLSSQRPSALGRLGLGPADLHAHLPALRHLNIVGEREQPEIAGHDLTYQARAGLLGGELPASLFADVLGAERAFAELVLLLRQPPGTHAEVGLFESLAPLLAPRRHGLTRAGGLLGGGLPAYGVYDARAGRVAIAALETHFRRRLYEALQLPEDSDLTAIMTTRTAAEWEVWARERDLPMAEVI